MGDETNYTIPVTIIDVIAGVPVKRTQQYLGSIIGEKNSDKVLKVKGYDINFLVPQAKDWHHTDKGRGLEILMFNPEHYQYVRYKYSDKQLSKEPMNTPVQFWSSLMRRKNAELKEVNWWESPLVYAAIVMGMMLVAGLIGMWYITKINADYSEMHSLEVEKMDHWTSALVNVSNNLESIVNSNVKEMPRAVEEAVAG